MSETFFRNLNVRILSGLLIAAIAFSFAACAGKEKVSPVDVEYQAFEDLRTEIREAIDDSVRETEAIALVDALSDELNALRKTISERKRRSRQLNANYDTSRADFEAFVEQVHQEVKSNHQQVVEQHRALLAIVTPDEWAEISKSHTKAMKAAIKSIQAI
jgi:predicted  nucleic acid-binding Zn-ribbon protein